jgi:WD40 repeat protein
VLYSTLVTPVSRFHESFGMFVIDRKDVRGLAWPRPGLLLLLDPYAHLSFYDTVARTERFTFDTRQWRYNYVDPRFVLSPDGRWLVLEDELWDLQPTLTGLAGGLEIPPPSQVAGWPEPEFGRRRGVAFSPSGRLGAWQGPSGYVVRDLPGLQNAILCPCQPPMTNRVFLSDEFLVRPQGKTASVYALATGELRATLTHTQEIISGAFSPDGRLLATTAGVTVWLWDPRSGECVHRFKGQRGHVHSVAFHPSGEVLGAPCPAGAVRFWNTVSGREVASYLWGGKTYFNSGLAFSPDGQTAAFWSDNVVVWDIDV